MDGTIRGYTYNPLPLGPAQADDASTRPGEFRDEPSSGGVYSDSQGRALGLDGGPSQGPIPSLIPNHG